MSEERSESSDERSREEPNEMTSVHYQVAEAVGTITLDAPRRRNALSAALLADLHSHLNAAEQNPEVRSVVLSHTGPVFSSGMDLTAVADVPAEDQPINAFPALLQRIWQFPKPVVARVNGKARAGGIGLIAACDVAIATAEADFAFTEVRLGLVPAVISATVLSRLHPAAALELFLTGETFDAHRAKDIGLLNVVVDDVDAEVARYTGMFRLCEPNALAATKAMVRRDRTSVSMSDDLAAMSRLSARYFASPEAQEGITAFATKRTPRWAE